MFAATSQTSPIPPAAQLPSTTATDMKRRGWRSIMADVRRQGHMVITNHNLPEAVILPPEEYERLVNISRTALDQREQEIEALKLKFRERMQRLQEPGANEKLANLMSSYPKLDGRVLAGEY